jgi:hypothetical protein
MANPARRARSTLAVEIALVLAIKSVALFAIWSLWFSTPARFDPERIAPAATAQEIRAMSNDPRP